MAAVKKTIGGNTVQPQVHEKIHSAVWLWISELKVSLLFKLRLFARAQRKEILEPGVGGS